MMPVLQIGPLALQLPGLLILIGIWIGLNLAEKWSPSRGVPANRLYGLVVAALFAGVIGARLFYVIRYRAAFAADPLSLISLNPGLFDLPGGMLTGFLTALILGRRNGVALWPALDSLTPLLAVFILAHALAQLASGSGFGMEADLPWSIVLWGAKRHPTQIYLAVLAALGLFVFWPAQLRLHRLPAGVTFLGFTAYSAAARILVEAFRGDSALLPAGFRTAQVAAWLIMAGCLWLIHKRQSSV